MELSYRLALAFLGPDDILVLEKAKGTVQRIVNGNIEDKPLLDVPVNYAGDRGMLGIAVTKNKNLSSTNVFLYFTESLTEKDTYNITEDSSNRLYKYELIDNKLINKIQLMNNMRIVTAQLGYYTHMYQFLKSVTVKIWGLIDTRSY